MEYLQLPPRRPGSVGALLDEYWLASNHFLNALHSISEQDLQTIVDPRTEDENCRSIVTIVRHVVESGYVYADYIRDVFRLERASVALPQLTSTTIQQLLYKMLQYTDATLDGRWEMTDEEIMETEIRTRWGSVYDLEQMLEHAIVHVLRHRRQIEYFRRLLADKSQESSTSHARINSKPRAEIS